MEEIVYRGSPLWAYLLLCGNPYWDECGEVREDCPEDSLKAIYISESKRPPDKISNN